MTNPSIFRAYDIRGIYGEELTESDAEHIGMAFAHRFHPALVVTGRDNRESSPSLLRALQKGLQGCGSNIIDVGEVPSPLMNYATILYEGEGGIMVTASHLEKEYNGFKIAQAQAIPLIDTEIQSLYHLIAKGRLQKGGNGRTRRRSPRRSYLRALLSRVRIKDRETFPLYVAVDAGNGTGGPLMRDLLTRLGLSFDILFEEPDGTFPNHHPDPTVEETLLPLQQRMQKDTYDLGIALDGDADRVVFLDEHGTILRGDQALALFSMDLLPQFLGSKVLFEVKCSRLLPEVVETHGGVPVMGKTGHSFIKRRMHEDPTILLAGEMSGHFFFREFFSIDDPFFASARMISYLSRSHKPMSELVDCLPHYYATPEIRVPVAEDQKFEIVKRIIHFLREYEKEGSGISLITLDGVRVEFPDGWGLIRASNTSPNLILRCEATSSECLNEIQEWIRELVHQFQ